MSDQLRALQIRFQDYLTGDSEAIEQDIVSTEDALAEHRLGAYYNAYRIRLIDCLATDFNGLQKELGDEAFADMVLEYLQLYPSQQPSVRHVGQHMVEFLQHSQLQDRDFLAELAEFEWTQGLCFDAADSAQIFRLDQMAEISPEAWPLLQLQFHPSLRWLDLHWNVVPYWVALDNKDTLPAKQRAETPTRWLLWRQQMSPHWRSLDVAEAWAVQAASEGASFADLCEGLLEWIGEEAVAVTAAGFLKQWIHDELIVAVTTE